MLHQARSQGINVTPTLFINGRLLEGVRSYADYERIILQERERGVPQDDVSAHMWLNLAAAQSTGEDRERSAAARDAVAARMTREDLSEAQRRAREWSPE